MGRIWSEENRFQKWLEVELAAADTLADTGVVPREAATRLRERSRIDVTRILEIESRVRHDVIAFTVAIGETVGDPEAARWLHYGLTSNDVVDTAQALLVREASALIEPGIERFGEILERRAWEFKDVPEIGRTHGVHAEPITFGLKIANWYDENRRDLVRFPAQTPVPPRMIEHCRRLAQMRSKSAYQMGSLPFVVRGTSALAQTRTQGNSR